MKEIEIIPNSVEYVATSRSAAIAPKTSIDISDIEQLLITGNIGRLNSEQRVRYVLSLCEKMGLDPARKPFDYIEKGGTVFLYANKGAAEQLRSRHNISITKSTPQKIDDIYVVTVEVSDGKRSDSGTGAVSIVGLKGEALANAMMKAETKAKRRATLSICGLNMLDETEIETISNIRKAPLIAPEQPEEGNGSVDKAVRIRFGKYASRHPSEVDTKELSDYYFFLEEKMSKDDKYKTNPQVKETLDIIGDYLEGLDKEELK